MDKIYADAKDKYVVGTYIYVNTAKAYTDSAFKNQYKTSELEEAFIKGALIIDGADRYKPVNLKIASGVGTIAYIKNSSSTASAATAVSVAD